jgi:hypothetical protein
MAIEDSKDADVVAIEFCVIISHEICARDVGIFHILSPSLGKG